VPKRKEKRVLRRREKKSDLEGNFHSKCYVLFFDGHERLLNLKLLFVIIVSV